MVVYHSLTSIYELLKDRYDLTLTRSKAVDEHFTIDCPLLTGKAHGLIFWIYDDGDMFVFDVMNAEQTCGTHFHPLDEESAAEEIIKFMEGTVDYKLYPYPQT